MRPGFRSEGPGGRVLRRLARIMAVAAPMSIALGVLAHQPGIGWNFFDCVGTSTGMICGGFVGNPLLWGPFGHPLAPLGGSMASLEGFAFALAWWCTLGGLLGFSVDFVACEIEGAVPPPHHSPRGQP